MARDAAQMASYLRQGKVDWVGDTAAVSLLLIDRGGAQPVAVASKNGSNRYRTLLVTHQASGIGSIEDLRGRSIAFQNASSTTAYYLPAGMLLEAGLSLEILSSPLDRPAGSEVGYAFARVPANSAAWVHKRVVDAIAVSDQDWANPKDFPPLFKADLRVFAQSPEVPRALELVRSDLDPELRTALIDCLLQLHHSEQGQQALKRYFGVDRFDQPTPEDLADLYALRPWLHRVREKVE
jgi:phosphonate transport system substrate-binding protein